MVVLPSFSALRSSQLATDHVRPACTVLLGRMSVWGPEGLTFSELKAETAIVRHGRLSLTRAFAYLSTSMLAARFDTKTSTVTSSVFPLGHISHSTRSLNPSKADSPAGYHVQANESKELHQKCVASAGAASLRKIVFSAADRKTQSSHRVFCSQPL